MTLEDGKIVYYSPHMINGAPRYKCQIDGHSRVLGGHSVVVRLRVLDPEYYKIKGPSVAAASVFALHEEPGE